jgi:hypothetical protein
MNESIDFLTLEDIEGEKRIVANYTSSEDGSLESATVNMQVEITEMSSVGNTYTALIEPGEDSPADVIAVPVREDIFDAFTSLQMIVNEADKTSQDDVARASKVVELLDKIQHNVRSIDRDNIRMRTTKALDALQKVTGLLTDIDGFEPEFENE